MKLQKGSPKFEEVRLHLISLSEGMQPNDTNYGLCTELIMRFKLRFESRHLQDLLSKWEYWTGCETFPIPESPANLDPDDAEYAYSGPLPNWGDNCYGKLRRQFCRFLADNLEEIEFYETA